MRFLLLLTLIGSIGLSTPVTAQDPFYEVFGPQDINLCEMATVHFAIESSAQLDRTVWEIIPGGTSLINPQINSADITFFAPGTYLLVVTSLTVNQQTLSDSLFLYVYGGNLFPEVLGCYEVDSTSACYKVCAYSHTTIQVNGGFVTWQVTGAESYTISSSSQIDIVWGPGGPGFVSLANQGCDQSLCFDILPQPDADFSTTPAATGDTLTICKFQEVYFENTSSNGLSYTWNFGDGSQEEGYDATHTYDLEGYYTVTLAAESVCECYDEKQLVIEVLPAPAPTLDCVNSVCPETRQRYTATTAGCSVYNWSVSPNGTVVLGGGSSDDFIEVIWHDGPDGFIYLSVSGCSTSFCSYTNVFRIPIISPDGPIDGDQSVCSGELTTYSAPYFPGTTYTWIMGPGGTILSDNNTNAITIQWNDVNAPLSSTVEVYYNNCFLGCYGTDVLNVTITPEITIQGDVQVCKDASATIQAEAGFSSPMPVPVQWHLENEQGQIVATAPGLSSSWTFAFNVPPGLYTWVATNTSASYCTETARQLIEVTATPSDPLGIIGETVICPGQLYGYTIDGSGVYGTEWVITDGGNTSTYSGQTCQHTFGPTPPYQVQAFHTDLQYNACASGMVTLPLTTPATLSITGPDEVCFNSIDSFSTDYVSGMDYTWEVIPADHGEIRRSNLNKVEIFWSQSGPATLRLHACGNIIDKAILVNPLPAANIVGPTSACANEMVMLTTSQPGLDHVWYNENEFVIGNLNSISVFPGTYAFEITDTKGCVSKTPFTLNTYPAPVVHLSTAAESYYCVTIPGGVNIVANTDGAGYTYNWFIDDVPVGPGGPTYNVTTFGAYHVEVTNAYGCTTVSSKINFANCCSPSQCGFSIPGPFPTCAFLFNDFSISAAETACNVHQYSPLIAGLTPGSVNWYIESNSEGLIASINSDVLNYTYAKPGYYHITMTGLLNGFPYDMTLCGHYQNLIDTIRAVADFKHEGICVGTPIPFEDLTTFLPGESIAAWHWNFDDPASGIDNESSLQHPSHIFASAGSYDVALTITLVSGCTSTRRMLVDVSAGPVLMPIYDPIYCEDEAMAFQLADAVYDIQWSFGDPGSGVENDAVADSVFHTFDLTGFYLVNVSASDINQCRSQAGFMVDITANTLSGVVNVDPITPLCSGDTATLTAPGGGIEWDWSTGEMTTVIEVTESNQYNVLILDQYHCTYAPPPVFVEVFPKPEVVIKSREIYGPDSYGPWTSSLHLCAGTEFELSAFASGNVSYHWTHGPGTKVIQFTTESANLPSPGLTEFAVIATDINSSCISDTAFITVEIFALPNVPVISLTAGSACSFDDNVLQVTNPEAGVTYYWSDGQTGATVTISEPGLVYVEAVNMHGCSAKSNSILINPSAQVDQIPGGCFIKCDPLSVCLPYIDNVASYTIYQNGIVFQTGGVWPSNFLVTADGSYTIEVTTTNGCTATSDPLDIALYTGVGSITVETWLDQDGDGLLGPGDVLLPGIPVIIQSDDLLHSGMTETVPGGQFVFEDYPASGYMAFIDRTLLSSQWKVVIDSVQTLIATCDDSVVVSLLLMQNCTVAGPDYPAELCPGDSFTLGDSTWTSVGSYTMHIPSATGCDSVFQVVITEPDSLLITTQVWTDVDHDGTVSAPDTLLPGVTIVLTHNASGTSDIQLTDGAGAVSWYAPDGAYSVSIDTALLSASYIPLIFEALVEDTICGSVIIDLLVESACPTVFVLQNATLCPGDSILVQGQWLSAPGDYSFTISDPVTLCDTVLDVHLISWPAISLTGITDWTCPDYGSIALYVSGAGPFSYSWTPGVSGDTLITGLPDGDYSVIVTDANGCSVSDTFTIASPPLLSFNVPAVYTLQYGDSVLISITGDINAPDLVFDWNPAGIIQCPTCSSSLVYPDADTTVLIQITDANSCTYELQTTILVVSDTTETDALYVPNVFSPNGDGINDYWRMYTKLDDAMIHKLIIFDRWGSLLYAKEEFALNSIDGWDGTFKGKPMSPGVFAYTAILTLGNGKEVTVKGDITLVR